MGSNVEGVPTIETFVFVKDTVIQCITGTTTNCRSDATADGDEHAFARRSAPSQSQLPAVRIEDLHARTGRWSGGLRHGRMRK